jgi:hypothetical protein
MTITENITLGAEPIRHGFRDRRVCWGLTCRVQHVERPAAPRQPWNGSSTKEGWAFWTSKSSDQLKLGDSRMGLEQDSRADHYEGDRPLAAASAFDAKRCRGDAMIVC